MLTGTVPCVGVLSLGEETETQCAFSSRMCGYLGLVSFQSLQAFYYYSFPAYYTIKRLADFFPSNTTF
jgi:hypothetical protein